MFGLVGRCLVSVMGMMLSVLGLFGRSSSMMRSVLGLLRRRVFFAMSTWLSGNYGRWCGRNKHHSGRTFQLISSNVALYFVVVMAVVMNMLNDGPGHASKLGNIVTCNSSRRCCRGRWSCCAGRIP